ncbi:AAA family ATPase [Aeromonas molluscorum]|uniref:AAA family ATPase n=1 Tax=Aeromonas molluscorum TaxID=271417 RepID=UPI003F1D15C8
MIIGGHPIKSSLDSDVRAYINSLPYWSRFTASKIYLNGEMSEEDLNVAYDYLLQELGLNPPTLKPLINISETNDSKLDFSEVVKIRKLENVEGVNALSEDQLIEFSPNLTIIYGENGSGKSGYVRLLKRMFHSKSTEIIEPDVNGGLSVKKTKAKITFDCDASEKTLYFPENETNPEFKQFSVFDGKSVVKHLAEKNEFEFRPVGLTFFSKFTDAILSLEKRLNDDSLKRNKPNVYVDLFDGESEIKALVATLSAQTDVSKLKEYGSFSSEDIINKKAATDSYDNIFLLSRTKDDEIKKLKAIKALIQKSQESIRNLNLHFSIERLEKINSRITSFKEISRVAKEEGASKFQTNKINGVSTVQWRQFLSAAKEFSNIQHHNHYPTEKDHCLLCQQNLSEDARILINNCWGFLKSEAESLERKASSSLSEIVASLNKLSFIVFPDDNILTLWLKEKHQEELNMMNSSLEKVSAFSMKLIKYIESRENFDIQESSCVDDHLSSILLSLDSSIISLEADGVMKDLQQALKLKTFLCHKEKLSSLLERIMSYRNDLAWLKKSKMADFAKTKITATEKSLSKKHFNEEYISIFNAECENLNGNFGIEIDHTGSAGKSFRQLKIKGKKPSIILSEGEQKVIALADFITEMSLSNINRGVFFDDPVTSLDERRKTKIALRLAQEAEKKQVVIFTHDLVFVSNLIDYCQDNNKEHVCHWIEKRNGKPGYIFLKNAPSYEKQYRTSEPAEKNLKLSQQATCAPEQREYLLRQGFTALRTCYEVLVINELFCNVVQRYNERVSVDSLAKVSFTKAIVDELLSNYGLCCKFMEGHTHSDMFAYKKPETDDLKLEIERFNKIKSEIKAQKKEHLKATA